MEVWRKACQHVPRRLRGPALEVKSSGHPPIWIPYILQHIPGQCLPACNWILLWTLCFPKRSLPYMLSLKDKVSVITLAGNGSPSGLEWWVPTLLSEEVMLPSGKNRSRGLDSAFPAAMCSPILVDSCPASLSSSVQQERSSSSQSEDKMRSCL